jgi:nucleoid DNA-binding protein
MCCTPPSPRYDPDDFGGFSHAQIMAGLTVPTVDAPTARTDDDRGTATPGKDTPMTQADMITLIAQRCAVPRDRARAAVDDLLSAIADRLADGERVHLPGIGSLTVKTAAARPNARNPRTGEPIDIRARGRIKFTAAEAMKARLAEPPRAQAAE